MLDRITPMVITYNEAPNIARVLDRLRWARRILVIDSGSNDATLEIIARYPQAQVVTRAFDTFAGQCNFGLSLIETPFVLSIDADYVLSADLVAEIAALDPAMAMSGYRTAFRYCIYGHRLRGTLYPARVTLYRPERAEYADFGHGHKLAIEGRVADLHATIDHDDRKSLRRWLASQDKYIVREADHLLAMNPSERTRIERLRAMAWPAPFAALFYTLIIKGCLFDGWPGWFYALQRTYAELLLAIELIDRKLAKRGE
ncbi:glycosyltransferase family 2 protein [Sphingomonas qilianensis]|uniref:Glycosyltransferase family 2 protein n=1 Tax=Sphingomonas qilianensis TaxID=1736690 RepID=A0ABU9XSS0_9SPHN